MSLSPHDALKKWHYFQDSNVVETFKQYRQFIHAFAGKFPLDHIRKRAEEAAYQETDSQSKVLEYFEYNPVLTAKGLIAYVRALADLKRHNLIREVINKYWLSLKFSKVELDELLKVAKKYISTEDFVKKIDALLEHESHSEIPLFLKYVDEKTKNITKLRQNIQKGDEHSKMAVKEAKNVYKDSPGLLFDLLKWHRKQYKTEEAIQLLDEVSEEFEINTPNSWWNERNILARRMIEEDNWQEAHRIISGHKLTKGEHYANAEWLLGWIELTKFKQYEKAAQRFMNLYQSVGMPVSKSRMAFWAGEAFNAMNESEQAKLYYLNATKLPGTFYGQMAIMRLRALGEEVSDIDLKWQEQVSEEAKETFKERFAVKALKSYGENLPLDLLEAVFSYVATQLTVHDEEILITELAHHMGGTFLGVWVAKKAQYLDTVITKHGYPYLDKRLRKELFGHLAPIVECFSHSIIRQESNFSETAVSTAKAKGLMQLMDTTAAAMRKLAPKFGLKHTKGGVHDRRVNVTLGTTHLLELLKKFDGYVVLALAAYNAGDFNVAKWIETFGDPRVHGDWINWMEKIPFGETRNYVQRVLENAAIYHVLFHPDESVAIIDWITRPIPYMNS